MFIVIDGLDGCGKATQVELVKERLMQRGYEVVVLDFPNYNSPSSAPVQMMLHGEIGNDPKDINPYVASSLYMVDRSITFLKDYKSIWGKPNTIYLANRYISANIIYQGSKFKDQQELEHYFNWEYDTECRLYGIPKEDMTIALTLPIEVSQQLMLKRYSGDSNKKDIHENNKSFLVDCYNTVKKACDYFNKSKQARWVWLDCSTSDHTSVLPKDIITDMIIAEIDKLIYDIDKRGS